MLHFCTNNFDWILLFLNYNFSQEFFSTVMIQPWCDALQIHFSPGWRLMNETWLEGMLSLEMAKRVILSKYCIFLIILLDSRFAKEYNLAPGRGYGSGVIQVLRKLASPHLKDVFQPAQAQFGGRGSFGNGGAMRAAPFALAFKGRADVCRVNSHWLSNLS